MTLRDHYRENRAEESSGLVCAEWVLKFIDTAWLKPIMEAFDDDSSGYNTISELNAFTDAKPESLNWRYVEQCCSLSKEVTERH